MLVSILILLLITFISVSFGRIMICLYKHFAKAEDEGNSFIETTLLGMSFITLILSLTSLFFPVNNYQFFFFLFISILYWLLDKSDRNGMWNKIKLFGRKLSLLQYILIFSFLIIFLLYPIAGLPPIDSLSYHIPSIAWIEYYPATPGIANIEERIGFNSNYLLISGLFTFRFLLNDPVYLVHILISMLVFIWSFYEVITSKFEIKRLILFVLLTIFIWSLSLYFFSTWTDTIPNIVTLYIVAKALLYPSVQKKKHLFHISIAVYLLTLKLSFAAFGLIIALFFIYHLYKDKQYRSFSFISVFSILLVGLWCVRNIIISGYMIYPVHQLDFFTFDWKVPEAICMAEQKFINYPGGLSPIVGLHFIIKDSLSAFPYIGSHLSDYASYVACVGTIFAIIPILISLFVKKKRQQLGIFTYWVILALIAAIIYWLITAPFFRFLSGVLYSMTFIAAFIIFSGKRVIRVSPILGVLTIFISLLIFGKRTETNLKDNMTMVKENLTSIAFKPFTLDQKCNYGKSKTIFTPHILNENVILYTVPGRHFFDVIPCCSSAPPSESNFQDYRYVEARGNSIKDGFRYNTNKKIDN